MSRPSRRPSGRTTSQWRTFVARMEARVDGHREGFAEGFVEGYQAPHDGTVEALGRAIRNGDDLMALADSLALGEPAPAVEPEHQPAPRCAAAPTSPRRIRSHRKGATS